MVLMFLADGFEESEAIVPLDILRRSGAEVKTVSIVKEKTVTGSHGIKVTADISVYELPKDPPEMIVLPGGMPGADNLNESNPVKYMVADTYKRGGFVAAICAAPIVFGSMGLLNGRNATCYPGFEEKLVGATIKNEKVVRDGNIITAIGMGAALDFGCELVRALKGKQEADRIREAVIAL